MAAEAKRTEHPGLLSTDQRMALIQRWNHPTWEETTGPKDWRLRKALIGTYGILKIGTTHRKLPAAVVEALARGELSTGI